MKLDGKKLKLARVEKGMSQKELSLGIGCKSNVDVYRYESGMAQPREDRLKKLAEVLGVPVSKICHGDNESKDLSLIEIEYTKFGLSRVSIDGNNIWEASGMFTDLPKFVASFELPPAIAIEVATGIVQRKELPNQILKQH